MSSTFLRETLPTASVTADVTRPNPTFNFGDFGLQPITTDWGFSRGLPVDRPYIESFLERHASDIRGRVLEVGDDEYTRRFGADRVSRSEVLDIRPGNRKATYIDDLTSATALPNDAFDCFVLTQVLVLTRDVAAALRQISKCLRPGGVALITVPGISHISPLPKEAEAWSWSFYPNSLRWLLAQHGEFDEHKIEVESRGNLKTTVAFLAGLAREDLDPADYAVNDGRYPLIVTARAVKRSE